MPIFYRSFWVTLQNGRFKMATHARLSGAKGVGVDSKGLIYISDSGNNRVRCVSQDGIIRTIAGTGTPGSSGDGGLATSAALNSPTHVAIDAKGAIYITDTNNHRIRRVSSGGAETGVFEDPGIIKTLAGTGNRAFSGDGGQATLADLGGPQHVAVDSKGNVYIADFNNHRVRRVGPDGIITTFAGSGPTGFGNGGFSGDEGPAAQARLSFPLGMAVDANGFVYICDSWNGRIRQVGPDGIITTFAGVGPLSPSATTIGDGGPATLASINPSAIALDGKGNVYIADDSNHRVRRVGSDGIVTTIAGSGPIGAAGGFAGDGGPAVQARLNRPVGVAVDTAGIIYIAEYNT